MFNGYENYFITQAVNQAVERAEQEIKDLEAEGKRPIYAQGFFEMISKDMLKKLDSKTIKSYIKERDGKGV